MTSCLLAGAGAGAGAGARAGAGEKAIQPGAEVGVSPHSGRT